MGRGRYGGLAQLVEHLLCKQGVNGSNPLFSTLKKEHIDKLETETSFFYQGAAQRSLQAKRTAAQLNKKTLSSQNEHTSKTDNSIDKRKSGRQRNATGQHRSEETPSA